MQYAVIRLKGKQYKVSVGDEILIDHTQGDISPEVLMVVDGDKLSMGKPLLEKAKVGLKVLENEVKGKKLHVTTFKAKARYRRKKGFRPLLTKVKVTSIKS